MHLVFQARPEQFRVLSILCTKGLQNEALCSQMLLFQINVGLGGTLPERLACQFGVRSIGAEGTTQSCAHREAIQLQGAGLLKRPG